MPFLIIHVKQRYRFYVGLKRFNQTEGGTVWSQNIIDETQP